ncbi:MAG: DUF222 domain-containing protein [Acidimicrobiia bacterium]|nr:DUF222 domain-containing protein [Acidimicrobiia bacterium]
MAGDANRNGSAGAGPGASEPTGAGAVLAESTGAEAVLAGSSGADPAGRERVGAARVREWAVLGEWLASPPPLLHKVDLDLLQERLAFMGRARATLAALEADVVAEISRREGDAAAEETLRRTQKRSRSGARKAVKVAAQLEWAPSVAEKLADGAITPEAASLILDAAGETPVDHGVLLDAAEEEPDDLFRRTLKEHVNERTSEQELERRRDAQRRRRRASISEQADGMFHLFAQFDPLVGNQVRNALLAKSDELFRSEDAKDRPTYPQRLADALAQLVCNSDGDGVPAGVELIVLADYDQVRDTISNARLADGTRLTEAEALAVACDAKILPGIFNKHTGDALLGRSRRKIPKWLRKQLIARDGACVGCGAHHNICQVHHIRHWKHGGQTTLNNTCLVCWRCHHVRIHQNGEQITRHPDGRLTLGPPTGNAGADKHTRPPPHDRHRNHHAATAGTGSSDTSHAPPHSPYRASRRGTGRRGASPSRRAPATLF